MNKEAILIDLTDAILSEVHAPGESLVERELCQRYKTSRTPMREVLWGLVADGLAVHRPGKGFTVQNMDADRLREIFEVRQGVEGLAARLCCLKCEEDHVAAFEDLRSRLLSLDEESLCVEGVALGRALHQLIVTAADNTLLAEIYTRMHKLTCLTNNITRRVPSIESKSRVAHVEVIDAILSGDERESERRMRMHIHTTYRALVGALYAADRFVDLDLAASRLD